MGRRTFFNFLGAAVLCLAAAAGASAQDFQRSYDIGSGGSVQIVNVSGDINLRGHDAPGVVVAGYKEGRD